jgi:hypothetical protein
MVETHRNDGLMSSHPVCSIPFLHPKNPAASAHNYRGGNFGAGGGPTIDMARTVKDIKALLTAEKAAEWLAEGEGGDGGGKMGPG